MVLVLVLVLGGAGSAYAKAGKPTTPDNLRADVTASSVTVTWDPSTSNAGVTIYFVQLNGQLLWTTEPTITLHLARSTTYELLVQAQDAAWRRSDWSDPLRFTTPDEFPVTTPAGVQVSASPGSLTVQWQPASSDAGVLDYTTTVRGGPDGPLAQRTTGTTATIDLPPGGDLDVTVRARDRAYRWSDTSDPVPVTVPPAQEWSPPGAPSALRAVFDPQDRVERVEWDAAGGGGDTTITYHLKLDGDEIESTRQLFVELFSFAACPDGARSTLAFTVSATSNGFESADSEPITLCFD
jgi:hypothetical protein